MGLDSIPQAIEALQAGWAVVVADDEDRENEGDIIMSAQLATPRWLAWMIRWTSGYLCAPMPADLADRLDLPPMVAVNQDPHATAYAVSVDAADRLTTGISAADRSHTLNVLADPDATPGSLIRPGHVIPLRAVPGGIRQRAGHTEAAVELMRLAGLPPVGVIGEVVGDDGEMMRLPQLLRFGAREGIPVITIAQLIDHLNGIAAEEPAESFAPLRQPSTLP